jgi:ribosomal protein L7/L12
MTKYQVRVLSLSNQDVPLVKALRLVAHLGLRDAKELSDYLSASLPCVLVVGVEQDVAEHINHLLQEAGASATVEESSLSEPMLLFPRANQCYQWHWLSGPTPIK